MSCNWNSRSWPDLRMTHPWPCTAQDPNDILCTVIHKVSYMKLVIVYTVFVCRLIAISIACSRLCNAISLLHFLDDKETISIFSDVNYNAPARNTNALSPLKRHNTQCSNICIGNRTNALWTYFMFYYIIIYDMLLVYLKYINIIKYYYNVIIH